MPAPDWQGRAAVVGVYQAKPFVIVLPDGVECLSVRDQVRAALSINAHCKAACSYSCGPIGFSVMDGDVWKVWRFK